MNDTAVAKINTTHKLENGQGLTLPRAGRLFASVYGEGSFFVAGYKEIKKRFHFLSLQEGYRELNAALCVLRAPNGLVIPEN